MEALFQERVSRFEAWTEGGLSAQIGQGNYSRVFLTLDASAAAKVSGFPRKSRDSRLQAYREHVVSLLQTLLVLRKVTFFFPLHFGVSMEQQQDPSDGRRLTLYMEKFEGSLPGIAPHILLATRDWAALAFQVLHGMMALSSIFRICHNDLYPRNVLVQTLPRGIGFVASVESTRYAVTLPFLATITDFGISSGEFVGTLKPEVCKGLKRIKKPAHFSFCPPSEHILVYEGLPSFSRDPYVVLKWLCYSSKELPQQPLQVKLWTFDALQRIDACLADFSDPFAQVRLFHHLFHEENLRKSMIDLCGTPFQYGADSFSFNLSSSRQKKLLQEATQLLERIGSIHPHTST